MGRDPGLIARHLLQKLKSSNNSVVEIPIEKILTPFIRDTINSYDFVGGPNCLNAAGVLLET